jgi:hypothetical protein
MADKLILEVKPPSDQPSEEPTRDAPAEGKPDEASEQDQADIKLLLDMIKTQKQSWALELRALVASTIEQIEFIKGNHFFDFWSGTTDIFNAFNTYSDYQFGGDGGDGKEDEDLSLSDLPTNFMQMLFFSYQAVLSADLPRNIVKPENADEEEDLETAKAATTIMSIVDQKNKARKILLAKLFHLWTAGHFWQYTRYVVDATKFKTHKETTLTISKQQVVPDRFVCSNCGASTPLSEVKGQQQPMCPQCGQPLSQQDVYPGHTDQIPIAEEQTDIPNGMVVQSVYGPLHVTFKPKALTRDESPIVSLNMEVSLGWLRDVFPDFYSELQEGMGANSGAEDAQQKQARQIAATRTAPGYAQATIQTDPTYSRDWVQPWAFSYLDDREAAQRLKAKYPKGCMIAHVDDLILMPPRNAAIAEEWTMTSTCDEIGISGLPGGSAALPVQKRFNNLTYLVDDFMERIAAGLIIADAKYIDTKQLNRKGILPGVFNPVARASVGTSLPLADLIHQFVFEIEPQLLTYLASLPNLMQELAHVPPQIFGGDPGENVQTMGGQAQQLATAKGVLNLTWNQIREQDAEADEQAVSCASRNMTEKWWNTVTQRTTEFRNEYVHPDQMKGSVHVQPEEDQSFPMTLEQQQALWEKILTGMDKTIAAMLFSEPKNVAAAIGSFGIKGVVVPGSLAEGRALHLIDLLMQGEPTQEMVPMPGPNGQMTLNAVDVPSVQPDMWLDDIDNLATIVPQWAQEHFDKWEGNDAFHRNLTAFYKLGLEMKYKKAKMMAEATGPGPGGPPQPGGAPPQAGPPGA